MRNSAMTSAFILATATALHLGSTAASATTVFDNGGPDLNNGWCIDSGEYTADDFMLASTTDISGVGFYYQNYRGITGWDGSVSYEILADSAGAPGASLATGEGQNVAAIDSGQPWCCGGGNAWLVTFDLEAAFSAIGGSTYWLKLFGADDAQNTSWWVTSSATGNAVTDAGSGQFDTGNEVAFYLTGDGVAPQVPLPAALPLLAGGLGFLAFAARRRSQRAG